MKRILCLIISVLLFCEAGIALCPDKTFAADAIQTQIKKTGNVVQFEGLEGTNFEVMLEIKPTLEKGKFKGFDSISVVHCGENLLDIVSERDRQGWSETKNGITTSVYDGVVTIKGTNTLEETYIAFDNTIWNRPQNTLPRGLYSAPKIPKTSITANGVVNWPEYGPITLKDSSNLVARWAVFIPAGQTVDFAFPLVLKQGKHEITQYVPYEGEMHAVKLPEICYGGEVDLAKDEMRVTHGYIESYNGEAVKEGWVSSTGGLDHGAQVVYPLEQPYTVKLQANETFVARKGINTLHSGDGLLTVVGQGIAAATAQPEFDCTVYGLPVLKFTGDPSAMSKNFAVSMDYTFGDRQGSCSVKWQGSSSLAYDKKNYTVKFSNAFEAVPGWGEQNTYCLKANYIDFSHSRNVVSAKLWGQISKTRKNIHPLLATAPNYGAVDGFPVCITINDEFMGVYTFNIPKAEWMADMGKGEKECILCAGGYSDPTLFRDEADFVEDFEVEYISDENDTEWAKNSLNDLIRACMASGGTDLEKIGTMIDWESVIDYYIFTVLVRGDDMIDKNYLLMTYDGKKWIMGAYDMDSTFGLWWDGKKFVEATSGITFSEVARKHTLFDLVKKYKKDELKARYKELRQGVLSEDNVMLSFLNFAGLIPRPLLDEDSRIWKTIPNTNTNNVYQIINWYRLRCEAIDNEIENM